jgi:hypothetical protein
MLQLNTLNKFSAGDLGYRVLFHNESPMSNDQLFRKVNNLLNEQGYNRVNRRNLLNQLTDNDKIKNIGQGKWALNDWDYEKKFIIDIMKDAFYEENRPLKRNELIKKVKEARKTIKKTSINIYIDTDDEFINLEDGRIILKEWKNQYRNKINKSTQIYHQNVNEIIIDAFNYYDKDLLSKDQIWEYAKTKYHNKKSSFKYLIANRKYLIRKEINGNVVWRLKEDYRDIIINSHGNKLNNINKLTIDLLKSNYGKLKLKNIIEELTKNYNFNKNSIRTVLDDPKYFKKIQNEDGDLILYLKEASYDNNINNIRISSKEFEDFMNNSKTEEAKFDFKQGFLDLSSKRNFDQNSFDKIMKNISALANIGKGKTGYLFIGVTDNKSDSQRVKKLDNITVPEFNEFGIVGIEREAIYLDYDLEQYQNFIINKIQGSKLPKKLKNHIKSNLGFVHYKDKYVLVFEVECIEGPSLYNDNELYIRKGPSLHLVDKKNYDDIYRRCFKN